MAALRLTDAEKTREIKRGVLEEQRDYLTVELGDPARYLPYLRSKGVLDQSDCEYIRAKTTSRDKVDELVTILKKATTLKDRDAFDVFVAALREKKVQVHIAKRLNASFSKAHKKTTKNDDSRNKKRESNASLSSERSMSGRSEDEHTPGLSPRRSLSHPVQDSSGESPLSSSHTSRHTLPPLRSSPPPRPPPPPPPPASSSPPPQEKYELHPEVGYLPNPPPPSSRLHPSPPSPSEDIDPNFGPLPPHPPRSSTSFTSPQAETAESHHDVIEPGSRFPRQETSEFAADDLPHPQQSALDQHYHYHHHQAPPTQMNGEIGMGQQFEGAGRNYMTAVPVIRPPADHAPREWSPEEHLQLQLKQKDDMIADLRRRNSWLAGENSSLEKKLEGTKEKLSHVTLEAQRQGLESLRSLHQHPQGSDLDDYAQLQEEKAKVEKCLEEERSRREVMRRERDSCIKQVENLEKEIRRLREELQDLRAVQCRPQHLPITKSRIGGVSPIPLRNNTDPLSDTPGPVPFAASFRTPHHSDYHPHRLPLPGMSPNHHRSSSGDGTPVGESLSFHSSNTSISSHSSKGSGAISFSSTSQATLV